MREPRAGPIRVLHLIDGLSWGGSQRWVWDIVRLSPCKSYKHYVVSIYPDNGEFVYARQLEAAGVYSNWTEPRLLRVLQRAIYSPTIKTKLVPLRKLLSFLWLIGCHGGAYWRILKAVRTFAPDVVHAHTFYGFTAGLAIKRLFGIPLLHSVPCLFSQMVDAGVSWMPKLYARHHSRVDCFFTGASLEELRLVGVPPDKTNEIRGVVDREAINAASSEREHHCRAVRRSMGLSDDAAIVLSVGRFHPSKGHSYALEAIPFLLQRISNVHWVVLGEGDQRAALVARAQELGVDKYTHLVGFHSDPLPYYAAADAYLRTNVFEAENLCSYQAMAMGLPVIGFDTGSETELLRNVGHGILVPNRDPRALATATAEILLLPDKGKKIGNLGVEYSRAHLDIRQSIDAFARAYTSLVQGAEFPRSVL